MNIKILLLICLAIVGFLFINCERIHIPDPIVNEEENTTEDEISINPNKEFTHPGALHTDNEFEGIKTKLEAGEDPWESGWEMLINNSHSNLAYNANPPEVLIRAGNGEKYDNNFSHAFNDAAAAYALAVRWKINNNDAYADKAISILDSWANTCEKIDGDSDRFLASGLYGYQFANAAELMRDYDGWGEENFNNFKLWIEDVFLTKNLEFLENHNNACISHYWANWDLANIASVLAIGILTDNADTYNYGIRYLLYGEGNGSLKNAIYFVHSNGLGQMQESGRDQGHALLCVGLLGTICEMAWHQGDDLYGYDNNRVLAGAEYTAAYNFGKIDVPFEFYDNCDNVNHTQIDAEGKGDIRPIWAMIHNHYVNRKGLDAKYSTLSKDIHFPEGGGGDYNPNSGGYDALGYGTLLYSLD